MLIVLSVKNKLVFIDGSLLKLQQDDLTYEAWIRGNNIVISWLYNFVSKEIITSILYASTAKEIWDDLKVRFSWTNRPRIFQLRRQLMSLDEGFDDVRTYYTKLKSIIGKSYLDTNLILGVRVAMFQDYNDSEYVMSFLMGSQ